MRRAVTQVEEGTQALAAAEAALDAGITEFAGARGGLETVGELEQRLNDVTPLLLEEDFEEALTAILANRKPRGDKERGGLPTPPPL